MGGIYRKGKVPSLMSLNITSNYTCLGTYLDEKKIVLAMLVIP